MRAMSTASSDPAAAISQPVRGALEFVLLRGAASFAVAALAVVVTALPAGSGIYAFGHLALPGVLLFVVAARALHVLLPRAPFDGDRAWSRAAEVDRTETIFAAVTAVVVPVAWLVGGAAVLVHHASDAASSAAVLVVWAPAGALLWLGATIAWADDCRERLALALDESDRRFRAYWSGLRPTD